MVFVEKAGIPAVGVVAKSFARAWQACVDGWGLPNVAHATIANATTGQRPELINKMVDEQIDAILRGLTQPVEDQRITAKSKTTEMFTVEMDETDAGLDAVNRFLAERDWSDGMAVTPPTPRAVEAMLKATKRKPQDVVMIIEPGFGIATVEKVAINAVMAGMKPDAFPVLLAALDCLGDPITNHRDMQVSGHTEAPMILVNGPIVKKIGLNVWATAMGPGVINAVNTAIGRAMRLCLINIGYCKAGSGDPNFLGLPTKFGMVIGENEEYTPWTPYHVDQGFKKDDSAVTLVNVSSNLSLTFAGHAQGADDTLNAMINCMSYKSAGRASWLRGPGSAQVGNTTKRVTYRTPYHPIILSPSRAVLLKQEGLDKKAVQERLWKACQVPLKPLIAGIPKEADGTWKVHPELQKLADDPNATVPMLETPEQFMLFVTGGTTHYGEWFYGTYGIATKGIDA